MTIVNELVTELLASGCVAQAQPASRRGAADTALHKALGAVIGPAVSDNVHQLQQPKKPQYPNVTFQPVGYERMGPDGLPILRADAYELHIRAEDLGAVIKATDAMRSDLINHSEAGIALGFDVTDQALDTEYNEKLRRALMAVQVYSLATENQAIPAAFVYAAGHSASEATSTSTAQTVEHRYHVALVTHGETMDAVQRAVTKALLGFIPASGNYQKGLELVGGDLLQHYGPLALWRNTYAVTEFISA